MHLDGPSLPCDHILDMYRRLLPSLLGVLVAQEARADLISWLAPEDTTSTTDVITGGTLVTALNLWGGTTPVTVNGVTFDPFVPTGWTGGGGTLMAASTTGDADYDQLLTSARTAPGSGIDTNPTRYGGIQLDTLGTLQVGQTYTIQVWYCDQRFGFPRDRVMNMSSVAGALTTVGGLETNLGTLAQGPVSGGLEADPNNFNQAGDTVYGQFCIGTFTRTTNDPLWLLVQGSHPVGSQTLKPHLTAITIREGVSISLGSNSAPRP